MEPKIHLLPEELTHKIAAGEVIERPASILKELMENALDAGATNLRIEIEKGGCASLRIIDDGEGMDPADVPLAFRRHATSKLAVFDDLYRLSTFGFRGEALPSIAAIARVELLTRQPQAVAGTRIVVENTRIEEVRETGCPVGTAIFVSKIFDAVPVRKKFLKTEATEQAACLEVITRTALSHEGTKIRVLSNGRQLWDIPAAPDKGQRLSLVLGKDTRDALLSVKGTRGNIGISGYISRPEIARSNTKSIYCYVNGRYVRDPLLNHAIMTAYRNLVEAKRYPAAALFLEIPPEDVDVNVHPAKLEVRFRNPRDLYGLIVEAILHSLAQVSPDMGAGHTGLSSSTAAARATASPAYQTRIEEALKRYTLYGGKKKIPYRDAVKETSGRTTYSGMNGFSGKRTDRGGFSSASGKGGEGESGDPIPISTEIAQITGIASSYLSGGLGTPSNGVPHHVHSDNDNEPDTGPDPTPAAGERSFTRMTYLGQTGGTYLVFSDPDGLILVDQHAAHERILYEQFRQSGAGEQVIVQPLLLPDVVALSPADYGLLMENVDILKETGMEIEPFGGHTVVIKSLPAILGHLNPQGLLQDLIEQLAGEGSAVSWQDKRDKVLISLACKGAVKAGQVLSEGEVARLCQDLDRLPFAATCPHGRPVWIVITGKQLARLFKRT
ncbi:MAG: DNA mismatch repair endonuclease MutL [Syntrophales bacterium]|jgi:DNA mismatch repair protein MutL|nr:DNA mismatch repair endonuclease MutL [Syntrophales bacterium]